MRPEATSRRTASSPTSSSRLCRRPVRTWWSGTKTGGTVCDLEGDARAQGWSCSTTSPRTPRSRRGLGRGVRAPVSLSSCWPGCEPSCRAPRLFPCRPAPPTPASRPIPACSESGWTTCDWSCAWASLISLASRRSSASPSPSLAQLFGVRRQAVSAWLVTGVPAARRAKVATVAAIADILAYRIKHERVPGIVRRAGACVRGAVDGRGHRGRRAGVAARFRTGIVRLLLHRVNEAEPSAGRMLTILRGGDYYRVADPAWTDPLTGQFAKERGRRWNPPGSFPVVYLNRDEAVARANVARLYAGRPYGPEDFKQGPAPDLVTVRVAEDDYVGYRHRCRLHRRGLAPELSSRRDRDGDRSTRSASRSDRPPGTRAIPASPAAAPRRSAGRR